MNLKFIQEIKNEVEDILSKNELIFEPTEKVSTEKFEETVHEVHSIEITVPVDYKVILQHQADDKELKEFRSSKVITDFGRTFL